MKNINSYETVGEIDKLLAETVGFQYNGKVYMAPGVKKHIEKKHKTELCNDILDNIGDYVSKIIDKPDYIGRHPSKIGRSMEFVKKIGGNLLVAIEVDLKDKYIYVASLYPITESKISNRINSGRFIKLTY